MLEIWMERLETWLWLAFLEAIEWLVLAADVRRRIEQAVAAVDDLEARFVDIHASVFAMRNPHGFN